MFDIIRCEADPSKHGFSGFYQSDKAKGKITRARDLKAAVNHRNRKTLVLLEDYGFDEGAVKLIAEKKKACFLIDLGDLIRSRGVSRAILMSKLRTFLRLCNKHGAFYTFATFAEKESHMRSPDEFMHIAMLMGINKGQARFALKMLKHYL
jgi:RNase P/RNase MRP subunit p30